MKTKVLYLFVLVALLLAACSGSPAVTTQPEVTQAADSSVVMASASPETQAVDPQGSDGGGGTPPQAAIDACTTKAEGDACTFTDQNGDHTGTCGSARTGEFSCSPQGGGPNSSDQSAGSGGNQTDINGSAYNVEQAVSEKAQGMTISYDALAFLTGDPGANSFFPPGKVADFWGFQYLRDNDPSEMGHAGDFLTSAAMNMLNVLTADQRAQLVALAESQVDDINEYGYRRLVLVQAFQNLLDGNLPAGTTGLNEEAVVTYSAELYLLDGEISYARAELMGSLLNSLSADQKAYLDSMVGKGMLEWPDVQEPSDLGSLDRTAKVAVMTYAADMFAWYAGSVEADVYFCPERHGTYFGSFYLKDIRAMSDPSYSIPTEMTGDMGAEMLSLLDAGQAELITGLVDITQPSLMGIVDTREQISIELRKFLDGGTADKDTVLALMQYYGELDGKIIYNMALNFTAVSQSLTSEQRTQIEAMRTELLGELSHSTGAFLYSEPIAMPEIPNSDFLFK